MNKSLVDIARQAALDLYVANLMNQELIEENTALRARIEECEKVGKADDEPATIE